MPDDASRPRTDPADVAAALAASLAVAGEDPGAGPLDLRSLAVGLRVGVAHPDLAQTLLNALATPGAPSPGGSALGGATPGSVAARAVAPQAADEARDAGTDPDAIPIADPDAVPGADPDAVPAADPDAIPIASQFLARAARLPHGTGRPEPETLFAWANRLLPSQVPAMGRVVIGMLADGAPADAGRGFGLAWSAGVRLPHRDVERLFADFTELELTICSVIAGRDLRDVPAPQSSGGLARMFAGWFGGAGGSPASREADAVLDRGGRAAQLGLVAAWNAWMAMRYRDLVPGPVFDQLVRPWVSTVGPLPDA